MKLSRSRECRIKWWIARLQEELGKSHAGYCKCMACYAARKLREEFGIIDED
jgi:hypothetical protein